MRPQDLPPAKESGDDRIERETALQRHGSEPPAKETIRWLYWDAPFVIRFTAAFVTLCFPVAIWMLVR